MSPPPAADAPLQLFLRYPALEKRIPHVPLLRRPSEVHPIESLGANLWIKRDDRAGLIYGGNKPRKLEFILAEALARGTDTILTFGAIGSHHALAVALCGRELGLRMILVAVGQPPTPHVRETLHRIIETGAQVEFAGSSPAAAVSGARRWLLPGRGMKRPLLVMPGGSSPLGCIGFIEAALELEAQVQEGVLPEPSVIVVPVGSMGTAAGLLAGLALTGLKSQVLGVVVNDLLPISTRRVCALADQSARLLRKRDPGVPGVKADARRLALPREWMGPGYGHPTPEAEQARSLAESRAAIALEETYSAKALAAILALRARGDLDGPVLFWHTFDSLPAPAIRKPLDGATLPPSLRTFLAPT